MAQYKILSYGHEAQLSLAAMPYDLLVPYEGRILKVQVKTSSGGAGHKKRYATFNTCTTKWNGGKASREVYSPDQFDLFALVFLPLEKVIFSAEIFEKTSYTVPIEDVGGISEKETWDQAVRIAMERRDGRR